MLPTQVCWWVWGTVQGSFKNQNIYPSCIKQTDAAKLWHSLNATRFANSIALRSTKKFLEKWDGRPCPHREATCPNYAVGVLSWRRNCGSGCFSDHDNKGVQMTSCQIVVYPGLVSAIMLQPPMLTHIVAGQACLFYWESTRELHLIHIHTSECLLGPSDVLLLNEGILKRMLDDSAVLCSIYQVRKLWVSVLPLIPVMLNC